MRAALGTQSPAEVLRYTTDVADVGPLRTATLLVYDGTRWDPGDQGALRPADGLLWSEDVEVSFTGRMAITVTSLQQAELPSPVGPRAINAPGTWVYDGLRDEVSGTTYPGLSNEVFVADRDLSPDALRADRPAPVEPDAPSLQVPETPYADRTAALAQEIAGYQPTAYDQALALQEYFRSPAFTYSTRLDRAQTADPLWDFLESRSGYCVQFATAMTIMARELGIPARVGVGFLPGSRGQDGQVTVAADRAHAWPELWFADAGWVRFEPTPGV
ncbi:MAG TPA: transglutaminaseTgpA domain-containing protein, partial [Actinotalea sp.]|nr:transglutaminaseTgpA domain-containing protein [Actinotalea sp.]